MRAINDLQNRGARPPVIDEPVVISVLPISNRQETPPPRTPPPVSSKVSSDRSDTTTSTPPLKVDIIQPNTDVFAVWLDMDGFAYKVRLCSRSTNRCPWYSTETSKVIVRLNHPLESCLLLGSGLGETERERRLPG